MEGDHKILAELILLKFDQLVEVLTGMDDAAANAQLPLSGSNSVVQLIVHCCGAMRRWSSSVNLGVHIPRDRDAEFTSDMTVAEARALAGQTRELFLADTLVTDFAAPPAEVPSGREHFWTQTCHGVLLHVLEEVSQHLGHAEITRDVLAAGLIRPGTRQVIANDRTRASST